MFIIAAIFYFFMCFISGWNIFWPLKMLIAGGLGDKFIAVIWGILLFCSF